MNNSTSIVNTLLESDHADYDPSLDPFSDPKNVTYDDLGYTYISRDDMADSASNEAGGSTDWVIYLRRFGLLTTEQAWLKKRRGPDTLKLVDSIDKVYIECVPEHMREATLMARDLTKSAMRRVGDALGIVDAYGSWPVRAVHVEYK